MGRADQRKWVRPALSGSGEELLHQVGMKEFLVPFGRRAEAAATCCGAVRLERAIGVIYRPETERHSHYFQARMSDQFDAVIHVDETRAVEPLEKWAHDEADAPDTYPTGL